MTAPGRHAIRRWQRAPGSLTRQLYVWGGEVRVQRLVQDVLPLLPGEAADLGLAAGTRCLVREVVLHVGDAPVVWARSVAPWSALAGPWKALAGLGQRPLAELLFLDPSVSRTPLRAERHAFGSRWRHRADLAWQRACGRDWPGRALAARSSVFERHGQPLRVFEAFVPGISAPVPEHPAARR